MYATVVSSKTPARTGAPAQTNLVGNFFRQGRRHGRHWIHACASSPYQCADTVGSRSVVMPRNRATLSRRDWDETSDYHCQFVPRSRCALGHRRRTALLCVGGGGWRILGRSQCVDVHRNQTFGTKIRGGECTLLADPPCRHTKPKCRTRTLVDWIGSVGFASLRCPSAGGTSLVARSFSLAAGKAGQMDGDI